MNNKEVILNQSLAIRTFPIRAVDDMMKSFKFNGHLDINKFETNIVEWLKPVIDLSEFNYIYPANGVTEGINYWSMQEDRKIIRRKDDYVWLPENDTGDILYLSCPSSIDGNYADIPVDIPVALDIAHIGSCDSGVRISVTDNVEKVFFSLSKCFGLRNYRIGYYFSRKPDAQLERLIKSAKYYNYHSMAMGEHIIKGVSVTDVNKELKSIQHELCDELNMLPSESVWLATTPDSDYNKFKRGDTNRISLCQLMKDRYDNTL